MVDTTARSLALREPVRPAPRPHIAAAVTAVAPLELGRLALEALVAGAPALALMGGRAFAAFDGAVAAASDVVVLAAHRSAHAAMVTGVTAAIELGRPTVVITDDDPYIARCAGELGAATLSWTGARATMIARIVQVASGEGVTVTDASAGPAAVRLSQQEQRVLRRYARGASLKAVAADLALNIHLVEEYVNRARAKYAAAGRPAATKVELYMRAVEDGLLPAPA